MSGVITKFAVTSMVMWMAPVAIMYGFYYQVFPGSAAVPALITGRCTHLLCLDRVHTFYLVMIYIFFFLFFRCESDVILGADTCQWVPGCHIS